MAANASIDHILTACTEDPTLIIQYDTEAGAEPVGISCHDFLAEFLAAEVPAIESHPEDPSSIIKREIYIYAVPVMLLLCVLAASGNLFVLLATCRSVSVKMSCRLRVLLSLVANDAWSTALIGASIIVNSYMPEVLGIGGAGSEMCSRLLLEAFRLGSITSQSLHLVALAIFNDAEGKLLKQASEKRNLALAMLMVWILPSVLYVAAFSVVSGQGFSSINCLNMPWLSDLEFRMAVVLAILLPAVVSVTVNASSACQSEELPYDRQQQIRTNLVMNGIFLLGWTPAAAVYVGTSAGWPLQTASVTTITTTGIIVNGLMVAKSLWNVHVMVRRIDEINIAVCEFGIRMKLAIRAMLACKRRYRKSSLLESESS